MSSIHIGHVEWVDLTVANAEQIKDFYQAVAGWQVSEIDMGGYSDYSMNAGTKTVAGVCHARGTNASLPPVWLVYINVPDLDESLRQCKARGGEMIGEIRSMGPVGRYCVIRDPAGAAAALFEPAR